MKKIIFYVLGCLFMFPSLVKADHIYHIDMLIELGSDGSAYVLENWQIQAESGSTWCKKIYDVNEDSISDFDAHMDEVPLEFKNNWDNDDSLDSNAGHYGITYTDKGMELCFGKQDYERHHLTFSYLIKDYIFNTEDAQVLYNVLLPEVTADSFRVEFLAGFEFKADTELWKFGFKGNSYPENGRLVFSNYDGMVDQYAVALVKFPLGTFDTTYTKSEFTKFDDVYEDAQKNEYEYEESSIIKKRNKTIILILIIIVALALLIFVIDFIVRRFTGRSMFSKDRVMKVIKKLGSDDGEE